MSDSLGILLSNFLVSSWKVQLLILLGVFVARAVIFAGGGTLWLKFSGWAKSHRIIDKLVAASAIRHDMLHGIKIMIFDAVLVLASIELGILKLHEHSGARETLICFAGLFVWAEIYFYYSHRLLHDPKLFWIHRHHHDGVVTNPWTSLSFSFLERSTLILGLVVLPGIFISQWVSLPLEGFSLYFTVNYALNVYGHLNVETAPESFMSTPIGNVFLTTTFHALHHLRYRGHYGLFTSVLDKFHGTYFDDYPEMHRRAIRGTLQTQS